MAQVEKLKIFLASPSDVAIERRWAKQVVEEINRTVAPDKGIVLELISSERAFPGYGKDGQAILNEQIAKMQEYDLFIGIMWKRIGTPTPRAKSGTAEEFGRAISTLRRKGKPQVWFYFRQPPTRSTTKKESKQLEEVLKFKKTRFRRKGLFKEYKTPTDFRDQFREHLILWLNQRKRGAFQPLKSTKKPSNKPALVTTITKSPTTPPKTPVSKTRLTRSAYTVKNPGAWIMLNEQFFRSESITTQPDHSIVLRISSTEMKQVAELRSLQPREFHNRKQVAYADQHEVGIMQVSSVLSESIAGKTSFNITLAPTERMHSSGFAVEMNYNNYSADEIAELRARLILLGQPLPKDRFFPTTQVMDPYNQTVTIEKGVFPELWAKLQTQPRLFLPKAWLTAVYDLKMSHIVEDVLELELGPIKDKVMPVRFRGKRRRAYVNQEPIIIEVVGNCTLSG